MNINAAPETMKKVIARRAAGVLSLVLFALILALVAGGHTAGFDDPIRAFFYDLRTPALTGVAIGITTLADKYFIICLCLLLLILPGTRRKFGVPLSAGALGTTLLNSLIKHIVQRPRPEVLQLVGEHGFSFPSGHSVTSLFFYGAAVWLVCRYVKNQNMKRGLVAALAVPMLLVGPTRVYLGVHYPTDVLGAWCLGFAAVILFIEIVCTYEKKMTS
jgi:undecaprenyl-diphosphatase